MRTWYRMQASETEPAVAEIQIQDFIGDWIDDYWGFGVTAKSFLAELSALPDAVKSIRVHINSPGGDVFAALAIANALRDQQRSKGRAVETIVEGLAASAATIVMMAGDIITVSDNALVMIHNPWSVAVGEAKDFRKAADDLDKVRGTIVATYQWHSSLSAEEITAMMDATTFMDADEAIAAGFATDKVAGLKAAASLAPGAVARLNPPERYRARFDALVAQPAPAPTQAPTPAPAAAAPAAPRVTAAAPAEVLALCQASDALDLAAGLLEAGASLEQVQARIAEATTAKAAAAERSAAISALCSKAALPDLAAGYIAGAMSVDAVKAHLLVITAKVGDIHIDGGLQPDASTGGAKPWETVFARK